MVMVRVSVKVRQVFFSRLSMWQPARGDVGGRNIQWKYPTPFLPAHTAVWFLGLHYRCSCAECQQS